jgi:hypothetical protein
MTSATTRPSQPHNTTRQGSSNVELGGISSLEVFMKSLEGNSIKQQKSPSDLSQKTSLDLDEVVEGRTGGAQHHNRISMSFVHKSTAPPTPPLSSTTFNHYNTSSDLSESSPIDPYYPEYDQHQQQDQYLEANDQYYHVNDGQYYQEDQGQEYDQYYQGHEQRQELWQEQESEREQDQNHYQDHKELYRHHHDLESNTPSIPMDDSVQQQHP